MPRGALLLAALIAVPSIATAQSSIFGVRGLGLPGRALGIQARAMGGGLGAVDPASAINPAAVVAYGRLSATATVSAGYRSYDIGGQTVSGLRDTRFPTGTLAGPVPGTPLTFALGYTSYTERTFDIETADTVLLRNRLVSVDDRLRSDGGVVDVRAAVGWNVSPAVWLGVGGHVLSGATLERIWRSFGDSAYSPVAQERIADYSARGVSVGTLLTPAQWLRVGVSARQDSRVTTSASLFGARDMDLPLSVSAGFMVVPVSALRVAVSGTWSTWSRADDDLAVFDGGSAFNTLDVGAGAEVGRLLPFGMPLRLGARRATLPFSPNDEQPREVDLSAGTAIRFAGGLAVMDLAVERVLRDGAGVSERAWQVSVGLRVHP